MLYHRILTGGTDPSKSLVLLKIQINTQVSSVVVQKHDMPPPCKTNAGEE